MIDITSKIRLYIDAADYLSVCLMYLNGNVTLNRKLSSDDVKYRVDGHWGTTPGHNFLFAHIAHFIAQNNIDAEIIYGVGHANLSALTNLYLTGILTKYYPKIDFTYDGLNNFVTSPSIYSFRSEINPQYPYTFYDGGELGYSFAFSQGYVINNKTKVLFCIIGDGESETGTMSSSWLSNKVIRNSKNGIAIPVLNLNGYKMGSKSILASLNIRSLKDYFSSQGYKPYILNYSDDEMVKVLQEIKVDLDNFDYNKSKTPIIILISEKGYVNDNLLYTKVSGVSSHRIPLKNVRYDDEELKLLERWLLSYEPNRFFSILGLSSNVNEFILNFAEGESTRIDSFEFDRSALEKYHKEAGSINCMVQPLDEFLTDINSNSNVIVISPDELLSNKFNFLCKTKNNVYEILNENVCLSWAVGYSRRGGRSLLISYESFMPIVTSMLSQHIKYLNQTDAIDWRDKKPSINIILTSLWWQNTYSHQNPELCDSLLMKYSKHINVYYPYDSNLLLHIAFNAIKSDDFINVIVAPKSDVENKTNYREIESILNSGYTIWNSKHSFDIVIVCFGVAALQESTYASEVLCETYNIKSRIVSIVDMTKFINDVKNIISVISSNRTTPMIFVYHGYSSTIQHILWSNKIFSDDMAVLGFKDKSYISGDSLVKLKANQLSRYDIVEIAKHFCNKSLYC